MTDRCPRCNALYVLVGMVHRCIPRGACRGSVPPPMTVKPKPKKIAKAKVAKTKVKGK